MSSSLEAKIVVLGAQGVGKTSLVQRYVKNAFNESTTTSTVGASFVTKRVLDSTSDTLVRLQIWDTAGQERFRSISRLYYRGANACLLCYDITDEHSFQEMTGWLLELKKNLGDGDQIVIHVVGTKSDIVAVDPARRRVPFERTIAYVAEQLYPSRASTPPPTAGFGAASASAPGSGPGSGPGPGQHAPSASVTTVHGMGMGMGIDSKRSSGFWGQDIGWDCCHEISAKDGEGVEEVFRVIARKLVEQRNKREAEAAALLSPGASSSVDAVLGSASSTAGLGGIEAGGSFRLGMNDKRRSWLMFPPSSVGDDGDEVPLSVKKRGRCC
ncbi:P-loop containing nucleoside triphosphate hydrolase protein [Aspergillus carlsbadensis]|nr:P-loop containing nucleoside triphosphate hydrolase protein [Aspergillus carlsbadensis]